MGKCVKLMAAFVILFPLALPRGSSAQMRRVAMEPLASNVLIPQSRARAFSVQRPGAVEVTQVSVRIDIVETTATTTIDIDLANQTPQRQEAELVVPVPDGAVVRGFAYDGSSDRVTAQVLPKDEAR
jgi:hypothetical protein